MYEVKYREDKNRIYVKLEGLMTLEEAKEYDIAVRGCVDQATLGYTFCIDMSKAQPAPPEVNDYLASLRSYMAAKQLNGSSMIVSSVLTKLQLSRLIKEIGGIFNVSQTYEEADKYLDTI
ncbi:protein kinase [Paenibacillus agilis]|uniref:Protein kinase n=1 Tax=Paenibacillus agilis TaxID=3020863 RepID=A0A559J191_9BACL|nr:protein kinase [Paenibacillus agilis]TVX93613.1 protein kinase [Paenibacillus agilis]